MATKLGDYAPDRAWEYFGFPRVDLPFSTLRYWHVAVCWDPVTFHRLAIFRMKYEPFRYCPNCGDRVRVRDTECDYCGQELDPAYPLSELIGDVDFAGRCS